MKYNHTRKIKDENLRKLIIQCTYNIKGLTKRNEIEQLLPIRINNIAIKIKDDILIFERENEKIAEVWLDANCYSNLEILKNITPLFGIEYTGEEILELMKYRSKILVILL